MAVINLTLGRFNNKNDAINAEIIAEQKYFGNFARVNSI